MTNSYDIIGDIHGQADALVRLLQKMGYHQKSGTWKHSDRTAIFVGDFIDRGPKQLESVSIARKMVDSGSALAVMGNHELNAIAWFLPDPANPGEYLREHFSKKYGEKNKQQHQVFLAAVAGKEALHEEIINWFLTLPLWLDLGGLRVVHACWHSSQMAYLEPKLRNTQLSIELMQVATREPPTEEKDTPTPSIFKAVETLTKGIEVSLPAPHTFKDKDGHVRKRVRIKWWDKDAATYQLASLEESIRDQLPNISIPEHTRIGYSDAKPVFFGHYWAKGIPKPMATNAACVDYSAGHEHKMCAYRFDGESQLSAHKFEYVEF